MRFCAAKCVCVCWIYIDIIAAICIFFEALPCGRSSRISFLVFSSLEQLWLMAIASFSFDISAALRPVFNPIPSVGHEQNPFMMSFQMLHVACRRPQAKKEQQKWKNPKKKKSFLVHKINSKSQEIQLFFTSLLRKQTENTQKRRADVIIHCLRELACFLVSFPTFHFFFPYLNKLYTYIISDLLFAWHTMLSGKWTNI